jgi:hypothetical protein
LYTLNVAQLFVVKHFQECDKMQMAILLAVSI